MGRLLRVLVILFLLLSIAALILGIMLFQKRELLKGRVLKLEKAVIALGTAVESEPPVLETKPEDTSKDISPCTPEGPPNVEFSDFWTKYRYHLELAEQAPLDLKKRRNEIMTYYRIDPITLERAPDPETGDPTTGEGTMQAVLDEVLAKAQAQYNLLNETRHQLSTLRGETVDTIKELNKKKGDHRAALKNIEELKASIAPLKEEIVRQKEQMETLEEEKKSLNEKISEKDVKVASLEETVQEKEAKIDQINKTLERMAQQGPVLSAPREGGATSATSAVTADAGDAARPVYVPSMEPGVKGKVAAVNEEWNFVVLELSDGFLRELLGGDPSGRAPVGAELIVTRDKPAEKFVAKVKVTQVKANEKLAVAEILSDWQQVPIQKGDVILY